MSLSITTRSLAVKDTHPSRWHLNFDFYCWLLVRLSLNGQFGRYTWQYKANIYCTLKNALFIWSKYRRKHCTQWLEAKYCSGGGAIYYHRIRFTCAVLWHCGRTVLRTVTNFTPNRECIRPTVSTVRPITALRCHWHSNQFWKFFITNFAHIVCGLVCVATSGT